MKKNKTVGLIIIALIYIFTLLCGIGLWYMLPESLTKYPIFGLLVVDIICTVIIYIFGRIFNNSSIYDPYWSVQPPVIFIAYLFVTGYINKINYVGIIFLLLVCIWSIRLTFNWALNFKNLNIQDWRYQGFKDKHPKTYFLIDLFGIELFPTVIVFLGMLPGFMFLEKLLFVVPNFTAIIAFVVMLGATIIELISDLQMYKFRKTNNVTGKVMETGLWKYSRHPNYFGEIAFWVGIWLAYFGIEENLLTGLLTASSPIAIFSLFVFVSIPMLEKRMLKSHPNYKVYKDSTNMLLIIPTSKKEKAN